ncbi:MAG: outer membrane protein assembly factor BamE [Magnetovibrionaceae bacterium]
MSLGYKKNQSEQSVFSGLSLARLLGVAALSGVLLACTPRVDNRGNLPDPEALASLKAGEYSRQDVAEILGSPTTVAPFDGETWYYVSQQTEQVAFFEPEVKDRMVLALKFDRQGILEDVNILGLEDGKEIELIERETPTAGKDFTVLQQIFGNLGRFNSE